MSENSPILSNDEVEALLKATQGNESTLSSLIQEGIESTNTKCQRHLQNISEFIRIEIEKNLSTIFRKKLFIPSCTFKPTHYTNVINENDQYIYTAFKPENKDYYNIIGINLIFLHQATNLLFGGVVNNEETTIAHSGKIGEIVTKKLIELFLSSIAIALKDYCEMKFEPLKTVKNINLLPGIDLDQYVHALELNGTFENPNAKILIFLSAEMINSLLPIEAKEAETSTEKTTWRSAIQSHMIDSTVTVNAFLADVNIKAQDFMNLKEGDTIPIGDPTKVYICLNQKKLFKAQAGQSNTKLVAKIISEV